MIRTASSDEVLDFFNKITQFIKDNAPPNASMAVMLSMRSLHNEAKVCTFIGNTVSTHQAFTDCLLSIAQKMWMERDLHITHAEKTPASDRGELH